MLIECFTGLQISVVLEGMLSIRLQFSHVDRKSIFQSVKERGTKKLSCNSNLEQATAAKLKSTLYDYGLTQRIPSPVHSPP